MIAHHHKSGAPLAPKAIGKAGEVTVAGYIRAYAKVSLDAVIHNFNQLRANLESNIKTMAVVKADAYGHGSIEVAKALKSRADYFAVATLSEGIELRDVGIENPILILGYTAPDEYGQLLDYSIIPTLYNTNEAELLNEVALSKNKKATVHIAVDTGMSRIGFFTDEDGISAVEKISRLENIYIEGIFSHYATADEKDKAFSLIQSERFDSFISRLEALGIKIPIKHMCNSAATIDLENKYDLVRLGIALYGIFPSEDVKHELDLIPAMEVRSHVIHVKDISKGTSVGYGQIYTAAEKRKIATVSIGYADGFNRCLTGKGYVLINGKRAPLVGKVCMDQIMVDVTDIENVAVGDRVIILGKSGNEEITAEAFGKMANSFAYEVICTFMPRIKRIY